MRSNCDAAACLRIKERIRNVAPTTQQLRNPSLDLQPSMLDNVGVAATLRRLVDCQLQPTGLVARFAVRSSGAAQAPGLAITVFPMASPPSARRRSEGSQR